MRQGFSGITREKLSELFPVILVQHDPSWKELYETEADFLRSVFGGKITRISHIGSTAVPGLVAKPTIDILLEILDDTNLSATTERMRDEGWR